MKKCFLTGLAILLPVTLTAIIVIFVFNLLTEPFLGIFIPIFDAMGLNQLNIPFLSNQRIQTTIIQFFILILIFIVTVLLGMIARWFIVNSFLKAWDKLIHKIPIVNTIYKTCQDVIRTIFHTESQSFKQVVMVRFPSRETYSIGLVTRENLPHVDDAIHKDLVAVFVPTTPNPTSGYLLMYKREELIFLDMSVEDAFKYVISCGVIPSPFNTIRPRVPQEINW